MKYIIIFVVSFILLFVVSYAEMIMEYMYFKKNIKKGVGKAKLKQIKLLYKIYINESYVNNNNGITINNEKNNYEFSYDKIIINGEHIDMDFFEYILYYMWIQEELTRRII